MNDDIFSEGYGIVPRKVFKDDSISPLSRLVFAEISCLCAENGFCFSKNKHLAEVFKVSEKSISNCIQELQKYLVIENGDNKFRKIYFVNSIVKSKNPKEEKPKRPPKKKEVSQHFALEFFCKHNF